MIIFQEANFDTKQDYLLHNETHFSLCNANNL